MKTWLWGYVFLLVNAACANAAPEAFSYTGSLALGRADHTATTLPSGAILVTGGVIGPGGLITPTTEAYIPTAGTWTAAAPLLTARSGHTATLLPNGKVLVVGGSNQVQSASLTSAELYDPMTNTWSHTGSLNVGHYFHSAVYIGDGKVLVVGGYASSGPPTAAAEIYDSTTGVWSPTGSLLVGRAFFSATLLATGKVLVAGGVVPLNVTSTAELYDPALGTWTQAQPMGEARYSHTATVLSGIAGQVLVAGGDYARGAGPALNGSEIYDPVTNSWTPAGPLGAARYAHTASLLPNHTVLVAGGLSGGSMNTPLGSAEIYDPFARSWSSTGSLQTPRAGHTAKVLVPGSVLVIGGVYNGGYLSTAEVYDLLSFGNPRLTSVVREAAGTRLRWRGGYPNALYRVDFNPDLLGAWQSFPDPLQADDNGGLEFLDSNAPTPAKRFYRLVAPFK